MNDLFDKAARASGNRAKEANSAPNSRSGPRGGEDRRVIAILWIAEECLAGRDELRCKLREYLAE